MFPNEKIVALIESLKTNDHGKSDKILKDLIRLSEKRGTRNVSQKLRRVYSIPYANRQEDPNGMMSTSSVTSIANVIDNDLFEIRRPKVGRDALILSEDNTLLLDDIIRSYKNKSLLAKHNIPIESRILLHGPPGTGKTLFAYVLAHELGISVMHVNIDTLISSYLGETGKNISKIFEEAESGGYLVLLDEFDAIAKNRDDNLELGELKRVVNVLLQNLDNIDTDIVIVAATNHEHLLDNAVKRRFAYEMNLKYLDVSARKKLISLFLDKVESQDINYEVLAQISSGLSGARIKNLINKALRTWVFAKQKPPLNELIIEEFLKYTFNYSGFNSKDQDDVNRLRQVVELLRQYNIGKYTYSYLENITEISHSTMNRLMLKKESI